MKTLISLLLALSCANVFGQAAHDFRYLKRNAANDRWEAFSLADPGADAALQWDDTAKILEWVIGGGGGLQNIVEDTTPQLGGELDAQGNNIIDLADVTFKTGGVGGALRTGTSAADKFVLEAYDVDGAAYATVIEADAGNDVILKITNPQIIGELSMGTGRDTLLHRQAAGDLAIWGLDADSAATYWYGVDSDAPQSGTPTNYERGGIAMDANGDMTLSTSAGGTGTAGDIVLSPATRRLGVNISSPAHTIDAYESVAGEDAVIRLYQTDNSVGTSDAIINPTVNGSSAGDPFVKFTISGIQAWSAGIDNSDNDKFKIGSSNSFAIPSADRLVIEKTGNVGVNETSPDTKLDVSGAITQAELSADPANPDEGHSVTWQSDGTGFGDDGDICVAITAGGVTKKTILVDFSALP